MFLKYDVVDLRILLSSTFKVRLDFSNPLLVTCIKKFIFRFAMFFQSIIFATIIFIILRLDHLSSQDTSISCDNTTFQMRPLISHESQSYAMAKMLEQNNFSLGLMVTHLLHPHRGAASNWQSSSTLLMCYSFCVY